MLEKIMAVRFDEETRKRIILVAAETDRNASDIIRLAVKEFLEKHK